jgi:hypothetical protein
MSALTAFDRLDMHFGGHSQMIVLVIDPEGGLFSGYIGGELIVRSRQLSLDGTRALLARGYDQSTPYNMWHANSDTLSSSQRPSNKFAL